MSTAQYEHDVRAFEDQNLYAGDDRMFVIFFKDAVHSESKSIEAGRPIYDEYDFIKIMAPGSKDSVIEKVNYGHQQRFPKQWAQYQAHQEQTTSGTPLSEVPWLTVAQRAEFLAMNVRSVEGLVGMPDNIAQKFMGFHGIKQRAQAYLDLAAGNAPTERLNAEIAKKDAELEVMRGQIAEMMAIQKAQQAMQAAKVPK